MAPSISPRTSLVADGSTYAWYTSNRVIGFRTINSNLNGTGLTLNDSKFEITNTDLTNQKFIPNKFNQRIKEELLSNLFVRRTQTLTNLGDSIKFKDPTTGTIITLSECTKPVAITKLEKIFLEWLLLVIKDTNLSDYNNYLYNGTYGLNTSRNYDIIIPEIIFDIICDRNMLEINKIVLGNYLVTYPLTNALYTKFQSYGYLDSDFNIEQILFSFYRFKIGTDIRTPITYDTNGIVLPTLKEIQFGNKPRNFDYIFIPQKHSFKKILPINLPSRPSGSNYFDNVGACLYKKKIDENLINYKTNDSTINAYFDYFVSPNGSITNDGLTPFTPKSLVGDCPNGKKVLLLPGTYTGWNNNGPYRHPAVLHGMSNHEVWGCGDKTIIDVPVDITGIGVFGGAVPTTTLNGNGSLNNLKVIWRTSYVVSGTITTNYCYAQLTYSNNNNANNFTFYRINFANQPGSRYTLAGREAAGLTSTIYFKNCTITGGTYYSSYFGNNESVSTIADSSTYTMMSNGYDPTYKGFVDNLLESVEFTPCYTLLPIIDDSNPDSNSIILENTANITNIPNFNIKLA